MKSEMMIDLVDDTVDTGGAPPLHGAAKQQRVAKYFDDGNLYFGRVNKYFPASKTTTKINLWEVLYDDGDTEDFDDLELDQALDLYQQNAALDDKKPPARRVTLSPTFQSDSDKESEKYASENESNVEMVSQSAARKPDYSNDSKTAALVDKKPPARRVKLSFSFPSDSEEESENYASENESDVEMVSHPVARKRNYSNDSKNTASDDKKLPKRGVKLSFSLPSDSEEEEGSENESDVEMVSHPVARKRDYSNNNKNTVSDDRKSPARRAKLSSALQSGSEEEEESENEERATRQSVARKRQFLSDSEEESSDDDATPTRLFKIKSQTARKKYARLEQQAWLGGGDDEFSVDEDSDDEDSDLEAEEGFHRYELEPTPTSRRQRTLDFGIPPPTPVALTQEEQGTILASIVKPADKALQKLLLSQDFQFTLLPHQFLAVRKVAGVPDTFPLHAGSQVVNVQEAKMNEAIRGLDLEVNNCTNKGVLIADDMGLGKTVEAIAGAMLRNGIAAAKKKKARPTVIVSPNDAVQVQWRDTLIKNGILLEHIHFFDVGQESRSFDNAIFLLMTRYTLQSEVKRVFNNLDDAMKSREARHIATSVLFPHADLENLNRLKVQYQDENTKTHVENKYREKGEPMSDCVARLVHLCTLRMRRKQDAEPVFETIIIDEAHFLKNIITFWGMGAALLSAHALRAAPLTGTPYNNGPSDLAAMMTFVDAGRSSARKMFWKNTTMEAAAGGNIRNRIAKWHAEYLVRRRKEDVLDDLVEKSVEDRLVSQYYAEQIVYNSYEAKMEPILKAFGELLPYQDNPAIRKQLKELHTILMAIMSSMRAANIHAMLPGGREYTKQFSPTRCHTIAMEERSKSCVCCDQNMRPSILIQDSDDDDDDDKKSGNNGHKNRRRIRGGATDVDNMEEFRETDDDAVEMYDEEEEEELVPLPCSLCDARNGPVSHFAHQNCIDKMKESGETCPRCKHAKNTTQYILPGEDNRRYCIHINGGFTGSSKLNAIVDWYQNEVPQSDKVLILSFYKASLDLLEGIFCHDRGIDCARFDGDLDRRTSIAELERFKSDPDCKILLASVQSGGVGLNIVEANHVAFVDRWYNPFVHLQAEDRCHRIGQTKDVSVVYFDCAATVDEGMLQMNKRKKENSAVLLADGVEIGNQQTLSYQELSGVLGSLLTVIRSHRTGWLEMSPENKQLPIPPVPQALIASAMEGTIARNLSDAAAAARRESSNGDESKPKMNDYSGTNGTEDAIVIDDDEEEAEFDSME